MAFNGAGVMVRLYNWTNDANASINIKSDRMDNEDNGFATALSTCICKDGQTTITANLPMSTFKHTGVGNASARTHYAAAGQAQDGTFTYLGTTGGAADVQTATATPTLPAYIAGQVFRFIAGFTNATTTPTLNIDGLGAKTIQKLGAVLAASDIAVGKSYTVMYDGTNLQLQSLVPVGASTQELVLLGTATASASAAVNFTSMISASYSKYIMAFVDVLPSTNSILGIRASTNNGSTWAATIVNQVWAITVGGTTAPTYTGNTYSGSHAPIAATGTTTVCGHAEFVCGATDMEFESTMHSASVAGVQKTFAQVIGAINAVQILPSTGTLTSGVIYLYGVKNT